MQEDLPFEKILLEDTLQSHIVGNLDKVTKVVVAEPLVLFRLCFAFFNFGNDIID